MDFGYCDLSVVCVHAQASFSSEITTQLLFADAFSVLDRVGIFLKIRLAQDAYEGWIDGRQCAALTQEGYEDLVAADRYVAGDAFAVARPVDPCRPQVLVPRGSWLPGFAEGCFHLDGIDYQFSGTVVDTWVGVNADRILEFAWAYVNTPYLWGGRSPCGIDCSGFVQMVFKMVGLRLRRDSSQQLQHGEAVADLDSAQAGDLVFAQSPAAGHVGILLAEQRLLHASARVRVDRVTADSIVHLETGERTHELIGIRRYLPGAWDSRIST